MKKYVISSIFALALIAGLGAYQTAKANPIFFPPPTSSAAATTTQTAVAAGATVVLTSYDSFANYSTTGAEGVTFLIQNTPAANAVLNLKFQYSDDGVDWYEDNVNVSTTTNVIALTAPVTFTWTPGTTATSSKAFMIKTPTRFVRPVASSTTAANNLWVRFVPTKQRPE